MAFSPEFCLAITPIQYINKWDEYRVTYLLCQERKTSNAEVILKSCNANQFISFQYIGPRANRKFKVYNEHLLEVDLLNFKK